MFRPRVVHLPPLAAAAAVAELSSPLPDKKAGSLPRLLVKIKAFHPEGTRETDKVQWKRLTCSSEGGQIVFP